MPDAKDRNLRKVHRGLGGEILSGQNATRGNTVTYPTESGMDSLTPQMGAGMDWLKKQQRGREAKAAMPGAMMAAGGKILSALGAATVGLPVPGHGAAGGTGGGGQPGVTASPLRGVPDGRPTATLDLDKIGTPRRPVGISATDPVARRLWERANGQKPAPVTDGFVKHGAVGNTARTIIHAEQKGHLGAAAMPALNRLQDMQRAFDVSPHFEPASMQDVNDSLARVNRLTQPIPPAEAQAYQSWRSPVPSGVVPEGSPVVNDGLGGRPVVTRAPAEKRKQTRLSQYVTR